MRWVGVMVCAVLGAVALLGCDEAGDDGPECDPERGRAPARGPYECGVDPAFVTIAGVGARFDIFVHEASHPLARGGEAFPCANEMGGVSFQAPDAAAEACSVAGVRPWHTVLWTDAKAACERVGWRLCTTGELTRACAGPSGKAYTFGGTFDARACNLREAYVPAGETFASEAPGGEFEACVSDEGAFDLTGNLREWSAAPGETAADAHLNQGGGWRTVAQRHEARDLQCDVTTSVPGVVTDTYASPDVGFRCCRDADSR